MAKRASKKKTKPELNADILVVLHDGDQEAADSLIEALDALSDDYTSVGILPVQPLPDEEEEDEVEDEDDEPEVDEPDEDDEDEEEDDESDEEEDEDEEDEDEEDEEDDEDEDEEEGEEYTEEEVKAMTIGELRAIAREDGIDTKGMKKVELRKELFGI